MIVKIFKNWLDKLNEKMSIAGRKILLTLDNAPVHPIGLSYTNIELFYFPPGLTSVIQPLDQSVISVFKNIYKRNLNKKVDFEMEKSVSVTYTELKKRFKLIDALMLILESWNDATEESITNCYRKSVNNSMIDLDRLYNEEEFQIKENDQTCFEEPYDVDICLEKVKSEVIIEDITNQNNKNIQLVVSDDMSSEEQDHYLKYVLTYLEAEEYLNRLENYCLKCAGCFRFAIHSKKDNT
ncbi:Tigger transposable element-derived protein 1 [Dictyocoela muelleri]|nr:Tigger transposable element-derived protein 1 [Dictyocoela muelleri]